MRSRPGRSRELAMRPKSFNKYVSTKFKCGAPAADPTMHKAYDFSAAPQQQTIYGETGDFHGFGIGISTDDARLRLADSRIIRRCVHLDPKYFPCLRALLAMTSYRRLPQTVTVLEAAGNSPSLARLADLAQESNDRLKAVEPLIPDALRLAVKAGPIDGESWCLLVDGNAAAAKIRQLTPLIQASLLRQGWNVTSIRLKVLIAKK